MLDTASPHLLPTPLSSPTSLTSRDEALTTLIEFTSSSDAPLTVDLPAGVIRGVKVLGLASANGRTYRPEALRKAAGLYEGAKVNVNHPSLPSQPRDYRDRLGVLRNVFLAEDGLRADLHFNPAHPLAPQLAWDAQHAPANLGLSHNAVGRTSDRDGKTFVEEIVRVLSVDVVADPATTRSLFESQPAGATPPAPAPTPLNEGASAGSPGPTSPRRGLDPRTFEAIRESGLDPLDPQEVSAAFLEQLALASPEAAARWIADRAKLARRAAPLVSRAADDAHRHAPRDLASVVQRWRS